MKKNTLEQVDAEIIAVKGKIQNWQQELTAKKTYIDTQEAERAELAHKALNDGDAAAKAALADVRQNIIVARMESEEIENETIAATTKIERLFAEREGIHGEAERAKYDEDVRAALLEAKELEATVQILVAGAAEHSKRLGRMHRYAESVGVAQIPFRLVNLERRVQTIFNAGHSVNKVYEKPYHEILRANVESVAKQLKGNEVPANETGSAQQEQAAADKTEARTAD